MTTAQKIKAYRTEKGLTQQQLADKIGVNYNTVERWENDKRKPSKLSEKILKKMKII